MTSNTAPSVLTVSEEIAILYFIRTKPGTEVSAFNALIETLPDKGEGAKIVLPGITYQGYQTYLTPEQAKNVAEEPIVQVCYPVIILEG